MGGAFKFINIVYLQSKSKDAKTGKSSNTEKTQGTEKSSSPDKTLEPEKACESAKTADSDKACDIEKACDAAKNSDVEKACEAIKAGDIEQLNCLIANIIPFWQESYSWLVMLAAFLIGIIVDLTFRLKGFNMRLNRSIYLYSFLVFMRFIIVIVLLWFVITISSSLCSSYTKLIMPITFFSLGYALMMVYAWLKMR